MNRNPRAVSRTSRTASPRLLLLALFLLSLHLAPLAQPPKTTKRTISRSLEEICQLSSTDKNTKAGPCQVLDEAKHVLATGIYRNGIKDSCWTYYNVLAQPIQRFDFNTHRLLYDRPDTATIVHSSFKLQEKTGDSDKVHPPYKIGGVNYGFYLLYDARDIPQEVKAASDGASMNFVFYITDEGVLKEWKIIYKGKQFNDIVRHKSLNGLPPDAYEFMPAQVNGHPAGSLLIYSVSLDVNHVEASSTNNIVTQH